ncbi:hypothetical protein DMB90_16195 [Raoultella planticola]|uniref:4Fe4S-binding SPASM domain-containing protein n=1 Tax=Raoultella planticola TaxID=575 RepID=A0A5P6AB07_RAOPL|nr:hypothetical protein DMB90_16195 [Raoultella planticola]
MGQYFTHTSATCVHAARRGSNLVMEPDGRLYACDHLINDRHHLGQLDDRPLAQAVDSATRLPFGREKPTPGVPAVRGKIVCQGGCPAHLNDAGYNRLCAGYFHFFSEILAPRPYSRDLKGCAPGAPALSTAGRRANRYFSMVAPPSSSGAMHPRA